MRSAKGFGELCLILVFGLLMGVGCAVGDGLEEVDLRGVEGKTWRMTKIVIEGKKQALEKGLTELTRSYYPDGSWKDNLGSEGVWSFDRGRGLLLETTLKVSPYVKGGKKGTRSARIVELREKLLILEFDDLVLGGSGGFGVVYLEPTVK